MFDVLSHRERRRILALLKADNPHDVAELGETEEGGEPAVRGREGTELELIHNHLPKLADTGFIAWDEENGLVRRGPRFEELLPLLDPLGENDDALPSERPLDIDEE